MGQVTIYLEDEIERKVKSAAKSSKMPLSKWIAGVIEVKISDEWPLFVVNLSGAWRDFPTVAEIREEYSLDSKREEL